MSDPIEPSLGNLNNAKGIIGSTANILVSLNKALLGAEDLPDNHPVIEAIKQFTVINCRTAKMAAQFATLPDISHAREQVEVSLSKLNTINTPPTKASFDLLISQYKAPAANVKQQLVTLDTLRNTYRELVKEQEASIIKIVKDLQTATTVTPTQNTEIKTEFKAQEAKRAKIYTDVANLGKELLSTQTQLNTLFTQAFNSIPLDQRQGIADKVKPQSGPEAPRQELG